MAAVGRPRATEHTAVLKAEPEVYPRATNRRHEEEGQILMLLNVA